MAQKPARHKAAIRPSAHSDVILIDGAALLEYGKAGHDVLARSRPRVIPDGGLIGVAKVIAAAVVGFEDQPALGGKELREAGPGLFRAGCWPSVDVKHERIFLAGLVADGICHNAIG